MKPYIEWTKEELVAEKARLEQEFAEVKAKGLNLNISRGKPAAAQLDLTEGMLTVLSKNEDTFAEDGTDCRNYGVLTGIPEARKLIGDICEVPAYKRELNTVFQKYALFPHMNVYDNIAFGLKIKKKSKEN